MEISDSLSAMHLVSVSVMVYINMIRVLRFNEDSHCIEKLRVYDYKRTD